MAQFAHRTRFITVLLLCLTSWVAVLSFSDNTQNISQNSGINLDENLIYNEIVNLNLGNAASYEVTSSDNLVISAEGNDGVRVLKNDTNVLQLQSHIKANSGEVHKSLAFDGRYLFLNANHGNFSVYDLLDPSSPVLLYTANLFTGNTISRGVILSGSYLFLAISDDIAIYDVLNPNSPLWLATIDRSGLDPLSSIAPYGSTLYIGSTIGLEIYDISDFKNILLSSSIANISPYNLKIFGTRLYAMNISSNYGSAVLYDIASPLSPRFLGKTAEIWSAKTFSVSTNFMFIGGLRTIYIYDVSDPSTTLPQVDSFSTQVRHYGLTIVNQVLYIAASDFGIHVYDVQDHLNVFQILLYNPVSNSVYAAKIYNGDLYVVGREGLQIYSLVDPSNPVLEGYIQEDYDLESWVTLEFDGNYLFSSGWSSELHVVDISDITTPIEVVNPSGGYSYGSDLNNSIYVAAGGWYQINIFDISDPLNPVRYSHTVNNYGRDVAIHNNYVFVATDDGYEIVNITDPTKPVSEDYVPVPGRPTRVGVIGDHMLLAGINDKLLRVYDISDITNIQEIHSVSVTAVNSIGGLHVDKDNKRVFVAGSSSLDIINVTQPNTASIIHNLNFGSYGMCYCEDYLVTGIYSNVQLGTLTEDVATSTTTSTVSETETSESSSPTTTDEEPTTTTDSPPEDTTTSDEQATSDMTTTETSEDMPQTTTTTEDDGPNIENGTTASSPEIFLGSPHWLVEVVVVLFIANVILRRRR